MGACRGNNSAAGLCVMGTPEICRPRGEGRGVGESLGGLFIPQPVWKLGALSARRSVTQTLAWDSGVPTLSFQGPCSLWTALPLVARLPASVKPDCVDLRPFG